MILIAIFDKKTGSYWPPTAYDHISQCLRSHISMVRQKPDANLVQFAEDFALYDVGTFDSVSGLVAPVVPPNFVSEMVHIVEEARNGKV